MTLKVRPPTRTNGPLLQDGHLNTSLKFNAPKFGRAIGIHKKNASLLGTLMNNLPDLDRGADMVFPSLEVGAVSVLLS